MSSSSAQQNNDSSLDDLLTSLQQGVVAINNITQSMALIFPSS